MTPHNQPQPLAHDAASQHKQQQLVTDLVVVNLKITLLYNFFKSIQQAQYKLADAI